MWSQKFRNATLVQVRSYPSVQEKIFLSVARKGTRTTQGMLQGKYTKGLLRLQGN